MTINNEEVKIPSITFGLAMKAKECGKDLKVLLPQIQQLDETAIASFLSLAFDMDDEKAYEAIEQYFVEGGDFTGLLEEINRAIEESNFFQAWLRTMEKMKENKKKK